VKLKIKGIEDATIVLKDLKKIDADGSAHVEVDADNFRSLKIETEGVASVKLSGSVDSLWIKSDDGSSVDLSGNCKFLKANIADAANVNAKEMSADYVWAVAEDAGNGEFQKFDRKSVSDVARLSDGETEITGQIPPVPPAPPAPPAPPVPPAPPGGRMHDSDDADGFIYSDGDDDADHDDSDHDDMEKWKMKLLKRRVWAGLELSLTGFTNDLFEFQPNAANKILTIDQPAFGLHINVFEQSFKLGTEYLRFVTGAGFQINYMQFKNPGIQIQNTPDRVVFTDSQQNNKRNTLRLSQFTVPALLNINFNPGRKNFHIDFGVLGNIRLKQNQVITNEELYKTKTETSVTSKFHQNTFGLAGTARIGFSSWSIFGIYDLTSLYQKNEGPDIRTWNIGITLVPF